MWGTPPWKRDASFLDEEKGTLQALTPTSPPHGHPACCASTEVKHGGSETAARVSVLSGSTVTSRPQGLLPERSGNRAPSYIRCSCFSWHLLLSTHRRISQHREKFPGFPSGSKSP